ncbi:BCCT family transporter [Mesobacillus maritimus]|uniref:glycine betaine uptake BCCT transporter n=1 Tax=Mesobacillus maritimus TaxID=1643336 RepID=UPI00203AE662|nr:BCCT family transporter [Mesobacillus maritimus]MCM3587015.1 BCCT family transporter [Mesobacillus maritimus]
MNKVTMVFTISVIIAVLFVLWGAFAPDQLASVTGDIQQFLQTNFGWFYLIVASVILVFAIYLIFSKYGKIKLGKDDEEPEYGLISWFAMLFSAGMGIGIVFYGVAEPLQHYLTPPYGDPGTKQAASDAMRFSFFHWGLHPWGMYAVIALALAYFKFRKGAPGLISATFYPLIGDRVKGWVGKLIDIIAVFATIFGVATSLGLGAAQINGGLHYIFPNIPISIMVQFIIIAIVTVLFILSAISGLGRGIKWLSNSNVLVAIILMLFLLFAGNTGFLLNYFTTTLGSYLQNLADMSLNISPFDEQHGEWMQAWTLFYWAWWIAWAPFVGTFIARVSRGRTIREFMIGVLVVPTIFCALWFSVFGGTGIYLERIMNANLGNVINTQGVEVSLFAVLAQFPLSTFTSILAIILISTFFITSADSATFVLGMQTTNGSLNPPNITKVIWGILVSAAALILLWSGGLTALQTASIIAAFPFAFILIFIMFSLMKAFREEVKIRKRLERKKQQQ